MTRTVTVLALVVVVCAPGVVPSAFAQASITPASSLNPGGGVATGELQGTVADDQNQPVAGAVVSALGATSAFSVTDGTGHFRFHALAPGPYLLRAHLQGFAPVRSALVQVNGGNRTVQAIRLVRRGSTQLLSAGVPDTATAPAVDAADSNSEADDHSEFAWRLRHLKRGALNDLDVGTFADGADDDPLFGVPRWAGDLAGGGNTGGGFGRSMAGSAGLAPPVLSDLPLSGQLNFLTSTSFDRPDRLLSLNDGPPHGVAYLSLVAPTSAGDWTMRGALTQGDLSSWVLGGSYVRHASAAHAFEGGLSYAMQRYDGGNAVALAAVPDGSRNAGTVYGSDSWRIMPAVTLKYGASYSRYDYLESGGLLSPRLAVTVQAGRHLRLRASASRRALAPGAEEFQPPSDIGVWLPPERTFSTIAPDRPFRPEQVAHYEAAAEQELNGGMVLGVRAFRPREDDQLVTVFGVPLPHRAASQVGHYYVASAGDADAQGWGVSVSRAILGRVHGSLDYTESRADWHTSSDLDALSVIAPVLRRAERERLRDLRTSVNAVIPATATRMFLVYRLNASNAVADGPVPAAQTGARFEVQVHQALPFLNFTNAQWAMLVAVRNIFREDALDASVFDEVLVVRPPKRIVGGLTVRF